MGVEIPSKYGGTGANFGSAIVVIEELAKVDAGVSVFCDIQNTLINTMLMNLGTEKQKDKYLPRFATDTVRTYEFWSSPFNSVICKALVYSFNYLRLLASVSLK